MSITAKPLPEMNIEELHNHYSNMLATANDIGFTVPDDLLVESDDVEELRKTCEGLDDEIRKFRAGLDVEKEIDESLAGPAPVAKKGKKVVTGAAKSPDDKKKSSGKKAAKPKAIPAEAPKVEEESNMAKAAKKTVAKKAAKKAAPAAKATKKASASNARTPVSRTKYSENAKIKVLFSENPAREGTGRFDRLKNLAKYDGKLVSDFLGKGGGSTGTLKKSVELGWIKIIG